MRAWKWALASASWLLGAYAAWSCLALARAGAAANIPQLEAAGAAELTAACVWILTGFLTLWNLWVSAAVQMVNALWTASLAWYYQDDTAWLWTGACALLFALSSLAAYRGRRRAHTAASA